MIIQRKGQGGGEKVVEVMSGHGCQAAAIRGIRVTPAHVSAYPGNPVGRSEAGVGFPRVVILNEPRLRLTIALWLLWLATMVAKGVRLDDLSPPDNNFDFLFTILTSTVSAVPPDQLPNEWGPQICLRMSI